MHRIAIVSKDHSWRVGVRRAAATYGFRYDGKRPELVLTFGGDGTLLHAERLYPGVPKLPLKLSPTCRKCHDHPYEHALDMVRQRRFRRESSLKLEATVERRGRRTVKMACLNDFILRNRNLQHAIRFSLSTQKRRFPLLIGDGVVVCTPFGSTAYFHSITKRSFRRGIGIAFNNVTLPARHLILPESGIVSLKVFRGPAEFAADNRRLPGLLGEGDTVRIRRSPLNATLLRLDA